MTAKPAENSFRTGHHGPLIVLAALGILFLAAVFFVRFSFAIPSITLIPPTLQDNVTTGSNWVYINLTASENLNRSLLEWGNSTGFSNVTMSNSSATNWYKNMTNLADGTYNYTIYAQNTTGNWNRTQRRFVTVDTTPPASITNTQITTYNFGMNSTWTNPADADFDHVWLRYGNNGTTFKNVSAPLNGLNATYPPHYAQNISAQTVDAAGNINGTLVWLNATMPNNAPIQNNQITAFNATDANTVDGDTSTSNGNCDLEPPFYVACSRWLYADFDVTSTNVRTAFYISAFPGTSSDVQGYNYTSNRYETINSHSGFPVWSGWLNNSLSTDFISANRVKLRAFHERNELYGTYAYVREIQVYDNSIGDKNVSEGALLNFTVSGMDLDGDSLTYGTNATKGAFNTTTGNFNWSISYADAGTYHWNFNVSDGYGGSDSETITVTVNQSCNVPAGYLTPSGVTDYSTCDNDLATTPDNINDDAYHYYYSNFTRSSSDQKINVKVYSLFPTEFGGIQNIDAYNYTSSAYETVASDSGCSDCSRWLNVTIENENYYGNDVIRVRARETAPSFAGPYLGMAEIQAQVTTSCAESWSYSGWSACPGGGVQTRTATDANSCGTTANRSALSQPCSPELLLHPRGGGGGSTVATKYITATLDEIPTKATVTVNLKTDVANPALTVATASAIPVSAPLEHVYQYLNITKTGFNNSDIANATIDFRVSRSWIDSGAFVKVYLVRYVNNEWKKLRTYPVNTTKEYNEYKAYTEAFSYFAVIGEKVAVVSAASTPAITFTSPPAAIPFPSATTSAPPVSTPFSPAKRQFDAQTAIVAGLLLALTLVYLKKGSTKKRE